MVEIVKLYADPVIIGRGMDRGSLRTQTVDEAGRPGPDFAAFNQIRAAKKAFTGPDVGHAATAAYSEFMPKWIEGQLGVGEVLAPSKP